MSFTFDFSPEKLAACINNPKISDWYGTITNVLPQYQINTPQRVANWLGQTGHESGDFKTLVENLNYGARGLVATWPKYFPTTDIANQYARKPEMIANRAYANRMGNGSEASGEGWKYRGRGIIQITGKSNYSLCSNTLYGDSAILLNDPDILCDTDGAVRSACWFWNNNSLNKLADAMNILAITKKINRGTNGLDERIHRTQRAFEILGK